MPPVYSERLYAKGVSGDWWSAFTALRSVDRNWGRSTFHLNQARMDVADLLLQAFHRTRFRVSLPAAIAYLTRRGYPVFESSDSVYLNGGTAELARILRAWHRRAI